jgi:hypothetical protein
MCTQALAHPYMAELHDPEDEPECDAEFDFNYETKESNLTDANIREMVFQARPPKPQLTLQTRAHSHTHAVCTHKHVLRIGTQFAH